MTISGIKNFISNCVNKINYRIEVTEATIINLWNERFTTEDIEGYELTGDNTVRVIIAGPNYLHPIERDDLLLNPNSRYFYYFCD